LAGQIIALNDKNVAEGLTILRSEMANEVDEKDKKLNEIDALIYIENKFSKGGGK